MRYSKRKPSFHQQKNILDEFSSGSIKASNKRIKDLIDYHWKYYNCVARQRSETENTKAIIEAVSKNSIKGYSFNKWFRVIKYKYAYSPLSTLGSLTNSGGRFNIGDINQILFPTFPALYVSSDKITAEKEVFGNNNSKLSDKELALTDSYLIIIISGKLESVFDLRDETNLTGFIDATKHFSIPKDIKDLAKKLKLPPADIIKNTKTLKNNLLEINWKIYPEVFDIPSNSQIFGQIISSAGIEGILYNSHITQKECLAIFPRNFENSSAFIEIIGDCPAKTKISRIDFTNFKESEV